MRFYDLNNISELEGKMISLVNNSTKIKSSRQLRPSRDFIDNWVNGTMTLDNWYNEPNFNFNKVEEKEKLSTGKIAVLKDRRKEMYEYFIEFKVQHEIGKNFIKLINIPNHALVMAKAEVKNIDNL